MRGFSATFLRDGRTLLAPKPKPHVCIGVFGKHPGWDDHMEGLGLETDALITLSQVLYFEGIGRMVNSGEWEKLDAANRLPDFDHLFLWKRGPAFLLGKIWSSRDGKGRSKYPMVAAAHCEGIPLCSALAFILPALEDYRGLCVNTTSAEAVGSGLADTLARVRLLYEGGEPAPEPPCNREAEFIDAINPPGGDDEVFPRVLYQFRTQVPSHGAGFSDWKSRSARIRLPSVPGYEPEAFQYWHGFLDGQVGGHPPILTVAPAGERWLDALIGEPGAGDFYFLLARPEAMAVSSEVGYAIEDDFRMKNQAVLESMRSNAAVPRKTWINRLLSPD